MKLSKQEKAAHRAAFRSLSPAKKLDHIFTYYKWPILLGLCALLVLGSVLHRQLTKKEPVLYLGLANVSVGTDLEEGLTGGFLRAIGADPARQEVFLYQNLYLSEDAATENHQYAFASRTLLNGATEARKLDLLLLNREAYDLLSHGGYLLDLAPLLGEDAALSPRLTANTVVLEDNAIAYQLGEAERHEQITETVRNGLELTGLPLLEAAGFPEEVYLGVVANSPRIDAVLQYLQYLASGS